MMNPYLSWAILLVVAGGLGWYYNGTALKAKTPVKPAVEKTEAAPAVKKPKRKAAKKEKPSEPSAADNKPEEKKQPVAESKPTEADNADEEIGNKELAERFAAVKSGTVPASGATKSQKKKNNKKSRKAPVENGTTTEQSTHTSSTTGADADDDLSSAAESPVAKPAPAAGYVSDMLEEPAPSASVLRVTGNVESQPKKQKPQSFKQVENKKQRQQRLKNEARKEQVQAAEQERRKLLEKQLHTARESERRETAKAKPAAPTTNAWQAKNVTNVPNGTPKAAPAPKMELLDTFDEASSAKSAAGSSNKWSQGLPSEEEQMRLLNASNGATDEWTTVSTKAKKPKKKGGKSDESVSEGSGSENNQPSAPVPVEPKVTVTPTYIPDILRSKQKGHPLDSDWTA